MGAVEGKGRLAMRVLITGAGGQLGHDLVRAFGDAGRHHSLVGLSHNQVDVGDRDAVLQTFGAVRPEVVVHAGAWTAVDACEADPDRAYLVNALGTRHVAEAARSVGAHMLYVSTDYVLDGTARQPYREWDDPNPLSVYGRSKLAGERELLAMVAGATVVRTSWVCSTHGSNMLKTVLRLAAERPELAFVDDQRGCPTFTEDL
ncbi:MAG TPA: NAD(P)-dependent oxidoreductase, partial [Acidimicrobiales bacterium]|nr:NAD(P)-dependent oxidoreductase [Acidimicrobiales bacterium]